MAEGPVQSIGRYVLLEPLARGGMAEVYLGKLVGPSGLEKFVAIKRILPQFSDQPDFIEMFKYEAKLAVNLSHKNIVSIVDFGIYRSQFYITMEYVNGLNLNQLLKYFQERSTWFEFDGIAHLVKEVAAGLAYAHQGIDRATGQSLNIVHRDISPHNIMVSFAGEIKIVDFGIAKSTIQGRETGVGALKGKCSYMSPEQVESLPLDARTDVFSLGIVLWELLTRQRLFDGNSEMMIYQKILSGDLPPADLVNPQAAPELVRIANLALAKDRNARYQSAVDMQRDLSKFLAMNYPEFSEKDFQESIMAVTANDQEAHQRKLQEFAQVQLPKPTDEFTATEKLTDSSLMADFLNPEALVPQSTVATKLVELGPLMNDKTGLIQEPKVIAAPAVVTDPVGDPPRLNSQMMMSVPLPFEPANERQGEEEDQKNLFKRIWQELWLHHRWQFVVGLLVMVSLIWLPKIRSSPESVGILVTTEPVGAVVEINGIQLGETPFSGAIGLKEKVNLRILKTGYLTYEAHELTLGRSQGSHLHAVLQPAVAH